MGRIEGLTKGVQGGLFTPNEAREKEGLEPVESGNIPYLQAQMTPINLLKQIASGQQANSIQLQEQTPAEPTEQAKEFDPNVAKAMIFEHVKKRMQA
jgi:hypothetical protein